MKMPDEKPLDEFLLTVSEEKGGIVNGMIKVAIQFFGEEHEVPPAVCAFAEGHTPLVFPAVHRNDVEKQVVWAFLRFLRETHPTVILVSEIWASKCDKDQDYKKMPRPSQDPNREEMVMINFWDEERTVVIASDITRNPDKLGEFTVRIDSNDDGMKLEGELAKGEPFRRKDRRYEF